MSEWHAARGSRRRADHASVTCFLPAKPTAMRTGTRERKTKTEIERERDEVVMCVLGETEGDAQIKLARERKDEVGLSWSPAIIHKPRGVILRRFTLISTAAVR